MYAKLVRQLSDHLFTFSASSTICALTSGQWLFRFNISDPFPVEYQQTTNCSLRQGPIFGRWLSKGPKMQTNVYAKQLGSGLFNARISNDTSLWGGHTKPVTAWRGPFAFLRKQLDIQALFAC